jgi:hypothetical protein
MSTTAQTVNTGAVRDRRPLRFDTFEQMWADVERIVASERAGTLRRTGNWKVGQTFGHLAAFINFAYDGYPKRPPLLIRLLVKPMKRKFIHGSLPAGVKIPGAEGGTWGIEPLSVDDGVRVLRAAWDRLRASPPTKPNPIFGPLTHDEWQQMHLRHAELHLSFLHPA